LRARRHQPRWGRLRIETPVAGPLLRVEDGCLPLEPEDARVDVWLPQQDARVVDQVARRKVVCAVQDDVVLLQDLQRVRGVEPDLVWFDSYVRVDLLQAF